VSGWEQERVRNDGIMIRMSASKRFTLAAGVIVVAIVGLIVWSLSGTTAYYRTPSELNSGTFDGNRTVRVAGTVVPGSIKLAGATTHFAVTDGADQVLVTRTPSPTTSRWSRRERWGLRPSPPPASW
jgi:heme/copper-type cytochrome/quinol oxidase subunit 2